MSYENDKRAQSGNASPFSVVTLDPASPMDTMAAALMQTVARKGRGFVLDVGRGGGPEIVGELLRLNEVAADLVGLAEGDGAPATHKDLAGQIKSRTGDLLMEAASLPLGIEVKESLRPRDEWIRPADYRAHVLKTTRSLAEYAYRYGRPAAAIVFCTEEAFRLVLDDQVSRGSRETVALLLNKSDDWEAWTGILGQELTHKQMMQVVLAHELNLVGGGNLIQSMTTLKATSTVNIDSDIRDDGEQVQVLMKTSGGESLAKFPKRFTIRVPVWEQDELDDRKWVQIEIRLEVVMPTQAQQPIRFILHASGLTAIVQQRVEAEQKTLREMLTELAGPDAALDAAKAGPWLIVSGTPDWAKITIGEDCRS